MAFSFSSKWTDMIADVTSTPEFQTATVEIAYKVSDGVFDVDTNSYTCRIEEILDSGRARIVVVRHSVFRQAAAQMNSRVSEFARVHSPKNAVDRVRIVSSLKIISSPESSFLEGPDLMVNSDF